MVLKDIRIYKVSIKLNGIQPGCFIQLCHNEKEESRSVCFYSFDKSLDSWLPDDFCLDPESILV